MKFKFLFRIRVVSALIFLFALVLIGRLYSVQIVHGGAYSKQADRQYLRSQNLSFERGAIFFNDRDGKAVRGASLQSGFTLAINPSRLTNLEETYQKLNTVVAIDRELFFTRAEKKDDPYEEIVHQLEDTHAKRIREMDLPGVSLYREEWRYYPGKSLASHVLGFLGFNEEGELGGQYGLERYYDSILSREDDRLYVNFFAEVFGSIDRILSKQENRREGDLLLTIEPSVQRMLESTLGDIQESWRSSETGAVIIDPETGGVFALGAVPNFDPNTFNEVDNPSYFSNPIVERVYEMGSIIKPITLAIGLETGVIQEKSTYLDRGSIVVDGVSISNYDGVARGEVPMQEVLNQSLNTGAITVAQKIGNDRFRDSLYEFGFGEESGIDLPNEASGLVDNLSSNRNIEYATASFGQGIALTPIATVRALSALANGGVLITPYVVKEIDYTFGLDHTRKPDRGTRVISEETSATITRMLVKVVDEALLQGSLSLPQYSIAAKTGTAQLAREDGSGYDDERFLHSFFGYFPAYEPRFLVFLYTLKPEGARYASETLTTPFMDIAKFLINYYDIPPDRSLQESL